MFRAHSVENVAICGAARRQQSEKDKAMSDVRGLLAPPCVRVRQKGMISQLQFCVQLSNCDHEGNREGLISKEELLYHNPVVRGLLVVFLRSKASIRFG